MSLLSNVLEHFPIEGLITIVHFFFSNEWGWNRAILNILLLFLIQVHTSKTFNPELNMVLHSGVTEAYIGKNQLTGRCNCKAGRKCMVLIGDHVNVSVKLVYWNELLTTNWLRCNECWQYECMYEPGTRYTYCTSSQLLLNLFMSWLKLEMFLFRTGHTCTVALLL